MLFLFQLGVKDSALTDNLPFAFLALNACGLVRTKGEFYAVSTRKTARLPD
jgi:hypothetical protein